MTELLALPFVACLVLTGIHAYLGLHVLARGVIFVGCDMATRGFSSRAAAAAKRTPQQVYDDIRANLVPGATLMPTGVFATLMAQEAGCSLMRST